MALDAWVCCVDDNAITLLERNAKASSRLVKACCIGLGRMPAWLRASCWPQKRLLCLCARCSQFRGRVALPCLRKRLTWPCWWILGSKQKNTALVGGILCWGQIRACVDLRSTGGSYLDKLWLQ